MIAVDMYKSKYKKSIKIILCIQAVVFLSISNAFSGSNKKIFILLDIFKNHPDG